ncbi:MAG TPA: helix-turn-helix domain-containing protein [Thermoanaerobaculia bacterium]
MAGKEALDVVGASDRAGAMLHPIRRRILTLLRQPASASSIAREIGLPRQKVNYHLRELEKAGFVEEIEQRRAGNCIERIVRAKATHYLLDPSLLGDLAADSEGVADRFSSTYLLALAAEALRDVAAARNAAAEANRKLATFALQSEIRFASAAERNAFATELANAFAALVARYHDENAPAGRAFKFFVAGYPSRKKEGEK